MAINDSIKNAALTASGLVPYVTNVPTQYTDKQIQYFSGETKTFSEEYAKYSSDFVSVRVQGIDPNDPQGWQTRMMRMADVVKPTSAIQRDFDNYKMVLFPDRDIEYVMPGTKIVTMGSTWLAVNMANASGTDGAGLIRRCNSVWNHLDYYGNVLSEPIIVENVRAAANEGEKPRRSASNTITQGYFNVICQCNEQTRQIDTNTRMILGSGAYRVTGFSDFEMEFTGDYSSVRLLYFTVRYEEPNDTIDDMENHVAGGKSFSWNIRVTGPTTLAPGQTAQYTATSTRNGENVPTSGEDAPTYLWSSSDESVIVIDESGMATAISGGQSATITATLAQNPSITETIDVATDAENNGIRFNGDVPEVLPAFESVTITASLYEGGVDTGKPLNWTFEGADTSAYSVMEFANARGVDIYSYGPSQTPLTIRVSSGAYSATATIRLEGL